MNIKKIGKTLWVWSGVLSACVIFMLTQTAFASNELNVASQAACGGLIQEAETAALFGGMSLSLIHI